MGTKGLFVDPGLRGCGVALFDLDAKVLARAEYVTNPERGRGYRAYVAMGDAVDEVAGNLALRVVCIELPRIYPRGGELKKTDFIDPNDILDVACVGAAVASHYSKLLVESVFPADWKGQVPKQIMTERIKRKLSTEEHAVVRSVGAKDHNTFDAVGIGLHYLGRLR